MSARGTAGGVAGEVGNIATAFVRRLAFLTQPVGGITGLLLGSQPVVQVLNDSGKVDTAYNGPVTISLQGAGLLGGTATVQAVSGIATYVNLSILGVGASQLVASVPGIQPVTSDVVNTLAVILGGILR